MIAHANLLDKTQQILGNAGKCERVMAARLVEGIDRGDSVQFQGVEDQRAEFGGAASLASMP